MRLATFFACFYLCILQVHAQSSGDIRTKQSGNWNTNSTWERFDGSTWVTAVSPPSSASGIITISAGHQINIPGGTSISADQLYIAGSLVVEANATLSLLNGTADDLTLTAANASLTVEGTFVRGNLTTIINPFGNAAISFLDGSIYNHRYTTSFGDLPAATWSRGSTVLVDALTSPSLIEANATWNQVFGNVIFDNPSQRSVLNLAGFIKEVRGAFSVNNTNGRMLQFSGADDLTLTIGTPEQGGDFIVTGNSRIHISNAGTDTLNIYGDLIFTSPHATGSYFASTGTAIVNVYGNFNMATAASGKLMVGGTGTTGSTTINLYGDFALTGGQLAESGSGQTKGIFRFLKMGTSEFLNEGTISGFMNYYVAPACTLDLGKSPVVGSGASGITVDGTLMLGSLDPFGAISAGTSNGNIRVPARTFNTGSSIIYNGSGKQFMSDSHPSAAGITTVIDNSAGVRFVGNISLAGELVLETGDLELNGYTFVSTGTVQRSAGRFAGGGNSSIQVSGTDGGSWGDIVMNPASDTLQTLEINRTAVGASATIVGPLKVRSALELKAGEVNNAGDLWMVPNSTIYRYGEARITGSAINIEDGSFHVEYLSSSPSAGPSLAIETGIELPNDPSSLASLTISFKHASDELHLTKDIWVNGNFSLTKGKFFQDGYTITMQGTDWRDGLGTFLAEGGTVVFSSDSTRVDGSPDPVFGNLSIATGSRAFFVSNFRVEGNIEFQPGSTFEMGQNVMYLIGGNAQSISANGATISNINILKSESQDITLTSPLNLTGLFQFLSPSSDVQFHSNGHLTLKSSTDAAGVGSAASVYRFANNNSITGDVSVERFMSGEGRIYRYLSSPVTNATVAQLKEAFLVQGNFVDPSPSQTICGVKTNSTNATLFWYDESFQGGTGDYVAYPNPAMTAVSSPLVPGRGYSAYIRQCSTPTIVVFRGPLNQGALRIPVTFTGSNPGSGGWNLVGNPYASSINWNLSGWTKTRIAGRIAIKDDATGIMRYYEPGVADDIPNGTIASGQAFWVQATGPNPSLTIRETVKTTEVGEFFRERSLYVPSMMISLSDGYLTDKAYLKIAERSTQGSDSEDAPKIFNERINLSTLNTDFQPLAINALPDVGCGEIQLRIDSLRSGRYNLSLDTRGFFDDKKFFFFDRYTGARVPARSMEFEVNSDSLSYAPERFVLVIDSGEAIADFSVSSSLNCVDEAEVVINGSKRGVAYSVWINETQVSSETEAAGKSVSFSLPIDSLEFGANSLVVKARHGCATGEQRLEVVRPIAAKLDISLSPNCNFDLPTAYVAGSETSNFKWYADLQTGPINIGSEFLPEEPGVFYVVAEDKLSGCVVAKEDVLIEPIFSTSPDLDFNNGVLATNAVGTLSWYYNGQLIPDENSRELQVTMPGLYELKVTHKSCMSSVSFLIEDDTNPFNVSVYPNPTDGEVTIDGLEDADRIDILSSSGQIVYSAVSPAGKFDRKISLTSSPDGLYLLIVRRGDRNSIYRLIKTSR